ncbi:MAG TPA: hypothetical protein VEK07_02960 [Polyangiaceae bacterium]|nr:hypothetical protein [Polyangiaceae bacterium]
MACGIAAITAATSTAEAFEDDGSVPGSFGRLHPEATARFAFGPLSYSPGPLPLAGGALGVRLGLADSGFYGGLTYMDYLANTDEGTDRGKSLGVEGGYGHTLFRMLIFRAQLGLGDYLLTSTATTNCLPPPSTAPCAIATAHSSNSALYFQPGALVQVALGPVLIGADASWFFLPEPPPGSTGGRSYGAFLVGAQLGIRL